MTLTVIPIGTPVNVGTPDDPIVATVSAFSVRGRASSIQYECVWWDGKTRKSEWVDESELWTTNKKPLKIQIGFSAEEPT